LFAGLSAAHSLGRISQQESHRIPQENKILPEVRDKIVKALYYAGAKLLAGSDSPRFFQVVGFALHWELQLSVEAGCRRMPRSRPPRVTQPNF